MGMITSAVVGSAMPGGKNVVAIAGPAALAVSTMGFCSILKQGEVAMVTRWGQYRDVKRGRFILSLPISETVHRVSIQDQINRLKENQRVEHPSLGQLVVNASLTWGIKNENAAIEKAFFKVKDGADLEKFVVDTSDDCLGTVIGNMSGSAISDRPKIRNEFLETVNPLLDIYGIEARGLSIRELARNIIPLSFEDPQQKAAFLDYIQTGQTGIPPIQAVQ